MIRCNDDLTAVIPNMTVSVHASWGLVFRDHADTTFVRILCSVSREEQKLSPPVIPFPTTLPECECCHALSQIHELKCRPVCSGASIPPVVVARRCLKKGK